jgi:hypothetical protein
MRRQLSNVPNLMNHRAKIKHIINIPENIQHRIGIIQSKSISLRAEAFLLSHLTYLWIDGSLQKTYDPKPATHATAANSYRHVQPFPVAAIPPRRLISQKQQGLYKVSPRPSPGWGSTFQIHYKYFSD